MQKFIDQELFNMCAVTALKISASSNEPIAATSKILAQTYDRAYQDDNLSRDIEAAAKKIANFLSETLPDDSGIAIATACTQMQFCIKHFKLNGSKKRQKILGGAWFSGRKSPIEDKVDTCVANIATYHMLVVDHTIPIDPRGWSL